MQSYNDLVHSLNAAQRMELQRRGIAPSRVSEWKAGRRLPTRPQAAHLADVTGYSYLQLERELAELEAKAEDRPALRAILGKAVAAGVAVMLAICGVVGSAQLAGPNALSRRR